MVSRNMLISSVLVIFISTIPFYIFMVNQGTNYGLTSIIPGYDDSVQFDSQSRQDVQESYLTHHFQTKETSDMNHDLAAESYFQIATEFFEWGWGDAIHMAPMKRGQSFKQSMDQWELWFARKLNITDTSKVVDMGMGIGGPLRRIAEFTGASVTGVSNVQHHINRATHITAHESSPYIQKRVAYVLNSYNDVNKLPANSYDVVYFMESLSHSNNRTFPLSEAYRLLKPGGVVGAWQWMLKDTFDYNNSYHMELKHRMELGGGLSNLNKPFERTKEFYDAGFKTIIETYDMSDVSNEMDWYPFWKSLNEGHDIPSMFTSSYFGRYVTMGIAWFTETIGLADKGTYQVALLLEHCADATVKSGKLGVFTPLWLHIARKPLDAESQ